MIKCVSERFEIDIRRVHVSIKFRARVVGDITGSDCYRLDPALATRICDGDCIFGKNHWILISERNRPAPESLRCKRNLLRRCGIGGLGPLACFGGVPVLAKLATKIAASPAELEQERRWP